MDKIWQCYGVYITDDNHIDDLFKIQDELNVPISLTLNPTVQPPDLMGENQMMHLFLNWLGEYYERGLRRCTLSFVHLMATGMLQKKFPEMVWKSSWCLPVRGNASSYKQGRCCLVPGQENDGHVQ